MVLVLWLFIVCIYVIVVSDVIVCFCCLLRIVDCLAFAVVIGTANHLGVIHVAALLTSTLAVDFTNFVATFQSIATQWLSVLATMTLKENYKKNKLIKISGNKITNKIRCKPSVNKIKYIDTFSNFLCT